MVTKTSYDEPSRLRDGRTPDTAEARPLSVLLVDPSPLTRAGLSLALVEGAPDLAVTAADSPEQAHAVGRAVDLVLVHAGGAPGEARPVARQVSDLAAALPEVPIVVLARGERTEEAAEVLRLGASGYLSHDLSPRELARALRQIGAGAWPPAAAAAPRPAEPVCAGLTPRQTAVLVRVRQGKSNKVIAFELGMQESTVKVHVRNIMKQLGASNRTEAVYLANLRDAAGSLSLGA